MNRNISAICIIGGSVKIQDLPSSCGSALTVGEKKSGPIREPRIQ